MAYIPQAETSIEQIEAEIEYLFNHWGDVYKNGCHDPTWHDGVNLNLLRNHIIYYYRLLDEKLSMPEQLSLFNDTGQPQSRKPAPPEVSSEYMAKPGELLSNDEAALESMLSDEN